MTEAVTVGVREANLFTFTGRNDTQITYSTTSITGEPRLSYHDATRDQSFSGDDIMVASSPLGTLVTVTLEMIPDLSTLTATLVLPGINLRNGEKVRFRTLAILTTNLTTIGGPQFVTGPLQTYEVVKLRGVAQHVEF
ncbi:MAG: hypothetical protein ACRDYX_16045 [Egibacteraceae bacterium]